MTTSDTEIREINWKGPYSWPGYEKTNQLDSIPEKSGVYLQTFEYLNGYLIFAAGISRRPISSRFKEHTRNYFNGEYNVLDIEAVEKGKRKEIWHGWGYARSHRDEFEENRTAILEAIESQLMRFRIFITSPGNEPRLLERIEASIMNNLYRQLPPVSEIPDEGMQLAKRWDSESPIVIQNTCGSFLYGLPEYLGV